MIAQLRQSIRRAVFVTSALILQTAAMASSALGGDFDSFLAAESESELLQVLVTKGEIESLDFHCQLEIEKGLFPESCMKSLSRTALQVSDPKDWKRKWRFQSQLCVKSAISLQSSTQARFWLSHGNLTEDCRNALSERLKDLEYISK